MKPILNLDEVQYGPTSVPGESYGAQMGPVAPRIGAKKLGYNVTVVAPGKSAFPRHNHRVNEEMLFVLEGEGFVTIGGERHPVRKGDFVAFPPGGPEVAHRVTAGPGGELRFLAVSTKLTPELVDYPDSGKFGLLAEVTNAEGKTERVRFIGKLDQSLPYGDD